MPSTPQLPLGRDPTKVPATRERRHSQSLDRGLAVLGCFTAKKPVLGVSEIAKRLQMSHATTHRYIASLVFLGYLRQREDRKYLLTLKVSELGMSALSTTSIAEHAKLHMQTLVERSNLTVALAIIDGLEALCLERIRGRRADQRKTSLDIAAGSRLPLHCTALGKLLLANLPEVEQRETLAALKLTRRTAATMTRRRELRAQLRTIEQTGIAIDAEELASGLCAIAVPVRGETSEVIAALSLTAHNSVIAPAEMPAHFGPQLIVAADHISARLGHRRPDQLARD